MAKVEQPIFILPKKRSSKKQTPFAGQVDHIITIQGADIEHANKLKNVLSPVSEHIVSGIIHSTMDGLKSNMKINLPIITDVNDEDSNDGNLVNNESQKTFNFNNGYQPLTNVILNRDIVDLSPIYENSSDACSIPDDIKEHITENELQKSCKVLNSDLNESSCVTPNSLSQTSENSLEMGSFTDSLKNSAKRKKHVNIASEITEIDNTDTEITAFRVESEGSMSPESSITENSKDYLTMTGTIKRGKKKGQNVDVKLNISREELEIIEAAIVAEEYKRMDISKCSLYNGPHVLIFTAVCVPFITVLSAMYSFYIGTITWYSIFTHVTEELGCLKKVIFAPIMILLYPFFIAILTVGLGIYAGMSQLTFSGPNWWKEVCDFEKGFYGWLCNFLGVSECSPYEVVILTDVKGT